MEFQPSISFNPQLGIRRVRRTEEWNPSIQAALRYLGFLLHIYSHATYHGYDILTLPKLCIWMKQQLLVGLQDFSYGELLLHCRKISSNTLLVYFKLCKNNESHKTDLVLWSLSVTSRSLFFALTKLAVLMKCSLTTLRVDFPIEVNRE